MALARRGVVAALIGMFAVLLLPSQSWAAEAQPADFGPNWVVTGDSSCGWVATDEASFARGACGADGYVHLFLTSRGAWCEASKAGNERSWVIMDEQQWVATASGSRSYAQSADCYSWPADLPEFDAGRIVSTGNAYGVRREIVNGAWKYYVGPGDEGIVLMQRDGATGEVPPKPVVEGPVTGSWSLVDNVPTYTRTDGWQWKDGVWECSTLPTACPEPGPVGDPPMEGKPEPVEPDPGCDVFHLKECMVSVFGVREEDSAALATGLDKVKATLPFGVPFVVFDVFNQLSGARQLCALDGGGATPGNHCQESMKISFPLPGMDEPLKVYWFPQDLPDLVKPYWGLMTFLVWLGMLMPMAYWAWGTVQPRLGRDG